MAAADRPAPTSSVGLLAGALGLATAAIFLATVAPGGIDTDERGPMAFYGVSALAFAVATAIGSTLGPELVRRWLTGIAAIGFLGLGFYARGTLGMAIVVAGVAAATASVHTGDTGSTLS